MFEQLKKLPWAEIILFTAIFILCIGTIYDVDFWWHLAVGKFIWQTKTIPTQDLFSFTMPDYPYVYHSSLTELILYLTHSILGMWGPTIFYAFVLALGFWLATKTARLKTNFSDRDHTATTREHGWLVLFLINFAIIVINFRTQTITFLGLSFLLYLVNKHQEQILAVDKKRFFVWLKQSRLWTLPPIFIVWVNLHGGFIIGLGVLTILLLIKFLTRWINSSLKNTKRLALYMLTLLGLVFLATLINPYALRSYEQALRMATNPTTSIYSYDWMPMFSAKVSNFMPEFAWYSATVLVLSLLTIVFSKIERQHKLLILIFILLALNTRRYLLPLLVMLIPAIIISLSRFLKNNLDFKKFSFISLPLIISGGIASLLVIEFTVNNIGKTIYAYTSEENYAALSQPIQYPYEAVNYMREHGVPDRLLNNVNWGGYLIWRFPDHRFFMDGRMDTFFDENGESFLKTYVDLMSTQPGWEEILQEYQIDGVLGAHGWPLIEKLKTDDNWRIAYQDETSILFLKND